MATRMFPSQLRHTRIFHNFTDAEIGEFVAACEDASYEAQDEIFSVGQMDRALHLIVAGTVQIELPAPVFEETPLVNLETGDVFGEGSFFHAAPHPVTARCLTPVQTLRFGRISYDALLARDSLVAYKLGTNAAEILGARLQAMDRWMSEVIQDQQDARIRERWREFRTRHAHMFHLTSVIRPGANMG
jgi:CRP-like cAMP-binding protein